MAHKSLVVVDEEGGREASGVAEKPRGYRQRFGGGVKSPQVINTPGVAELPRADGTLGVSADKSAECSGAESEGSSTEAEATTT